MEDELVLGRNRYGLANNVSIARAKSAEGHPGMKEFKDVHLKKYPATKIPERQLSVSQCELILKYIAKRSSDPDFDTMAHLSYLGFNSLMDYVGGSDLHSPIFEDNPERTIINQEQAINEPFFHRYKRYTENWLTLDGTSKLFDKSMMKELAKREESGEFKSIELECVQPEQSDYCKLANIGFWAVSFLKLLAIEKSNIRNQYDTTKISLLEVIDLPYDGQYLDIYKFPRIDLRNVKLPLKSETLYLFYRGAMIIENIDMNFSMNRQRSILQNAGFAYLRRYKLEAVAQFHHIWNTKLECSVDQFFTRLFNDFPTKWAHIGFYTASLVYYWCKFRIDKLSSSTNRYATYARLFSREYHKPYGAEDNELLVAILIGVSNRSLAPQLELNQYKVEGDEYKEAERFGMSLRPKCRRDNQRSDPLAQIMGMMSRCGNY